jgi:glycosyltransferase involved in cell wall biosynthesis
MTNPPTVSIIMSVYNESTAEVQNTIENMLRQNYVPYEVLVVLDSPDNHAVRDCLKNLAYENPKIKTIFNESNLGLGASLNKAVAVATGEFLARMDISDVSDPDRLKKQVEHLEKYPNTDLLFTGWREIFEDGSERVIIPKREHFKNIKKYFFVKSLLLHASLMVRREIFLEYKYPPIGRPEDFILFLTLMRKGFCFDVVEEALYTYHIDRKDKYRKIRQYTTNFLPHLFKNIRYYWQNPWFWLYFLRIFGEYLVSRNEWIFDNVHQLAGRIWKRVSK